MKVSKPDRLTMLLKVIANGGMLDRSEILERMIARLGISENDYAEQRLHDDLHALLNKGSIFVDDSSPRRHLYFIKADVYDVIGQNYLEARQSRISVPDLIKKCGVSINQNIQDHTGRSDIFIYFELNDDFLCLRVNKTALPFQVHLSRRELLPPKNMGEIITQTHGERCISLEVNVKSISSFKDSKVTGHMVLNFSEEGIEVVDFKSTYGTAYFSLTPEEAAEMIDRADLFGKHTIDKWVGDEKLERMTKLIPFIPQQLKFPAVLSCSKKFNLLIIK